MGEKPKSRTTIPMNKHTSGLHDGHRQLIKLAHTIGDRVVVPMLFNVRDWYTYLIDGIVPQMEEVNIDKQLNELTAYNTHPMVMPFYEIPLEKRLEWRHKAEGVLEKFQQYLCTPLYQRFALALAMDLCRQIERSKGNVKYMVKGPEWHSFLIKAIKPLLGSPVEVIIYNKIEKHEESKIKLQSGLSKIDPVHYPEIYRLKSVMEGAKDRFIIGSNEKLVEELNAAYYSRPWKIVSITVFEGGIIPGRLETMQFTFPNPKGGSIILEEVNYEL
jgi:hypothetical protein